MRTYILLSVVSFFFISQLATAQTKMPQYPKYKDVVSLFFTMYTTKNNAEDQQFVFAKKPDGWHAMVVNYLKKDVIKDELFWSRKAKKYLEIDFPHYVQAAIDPNYNDLINNSWAISSSGLVPYWGYDGWEMDVIKEFAGKTNLSDSLLNAVARAYSSQARSLTDYSEFGNPDKFKKLPKGQNALNAEILAKFLEYQHLSNEYYYRLYKQNPKFETFVSDIYNVYSSEIMNTFLTLRYFQNEETAQKELKKGLYDPFYIEMAKNYLNSCDQDAILFTNGDLDTYPLLYVQETENFRKDVLVVNLSLLNLGRYIYQLATCKNGAKPLKLGLDKEIYKSGSKPFFYIIEKLDNAMPMHEMLNFVASTDSSTKYQSTDNQLIDYIPSRDIYFTINRDNIIKEYNENMLLVDSAFKINIIKNFLYVSDFCVLDIIATNNFERPIYFASTVGGESYSYIEDYLTVEALAYKISPIKHEKTDNYLVGKVNTDVLYSKLYDKLKFDKTFYKNLGESQKRIGTNYRMIFLRLANQYIEETKADKALLVMDKCLDLFPSEIFGFDYYTLEFTKNYFKIEETTKAKLLMVKLINAIGSKIEKLKKSPKSDENAYQLKLQAYMLTELSRVSTEYLPNDKVTSDLKLKAEQYEYLLQDSDN